MRKIIASIAAATFLAVPTFASANHVTDVDGPAVSSLNGICHSQAGPAAYVMHGQAFTIYWNAMIAAGGPNSAAGRIYYNAAMHHYQLISWFRVACHY